MKKIILISILIQAFIINNINGQDSFNLFSDVSIGFLPIFIAGTQDVGDGNETVIGNYTTPSAPVYKYIETSGLMINLVTHFGASIPFYSTEKWSTGAKLSVGFGYQKDIKNTEGLSSFLFNLPEYIYYRNYSTGFDFSILLGYQYTYTALNSHLMMMAFDYNINENKSLRLYGSLFRYKYYNLYSNGRIEPSTKIGEFGFTYIYNF
ncbi:MAG: hypothetical protein HYU68_03465 [Bacteroidetes bacterium]|nr:hypothetical protein [Bacteroidota bacterium]